MTRPAGGGRPGRGKPGGGGSGKPGGDGSGSEIGKLSPDAFARALVARMEACPDAETLNDRVLQPVIAALEAVCGARGYVLNVYGDTANVVFTGDEEDAETIYQLVEAYLDGRADDAG